MNSKSQNQIIGIIGAMEEEVTYLRDQLVGRQDLNVAGYEFHSGQLSGQQVVLLKSGIGKVNAAIGTTILLERFQPLCIINTGSAGGFAQDLDIGDVVISSEVRQHDFDLTVFGYEHGQVPQMPAAFTPDPKLVEIAQESIRKVQDVKTVLGLIATGDAFMNDPEKVAEARAKFPDMLAAEMEAGAIGQTCFRYQVPFIIFRALSDIAGKESSVSFKEFLEQAGIHSAHMVIEMVRELGELKKHC
ncbi:5'-methylthioadenosine/S-adenosylhomocysteine nucleosidase [Motiliproteus sp. MSK22-1]|uniref:5'-methylthioadenosine/S-adenosylhomocysteine nucleosidase n=1 Tax=Motiliproteus sp. MSK22-1 TaxID=1897630 RepID=UPI000978816E|nr:5'-methylthioadenosine/S-adenosylhomocysteine nucleosidase [Motiliproteus sp. MSK22-1]OMH32858.1 5'-methylthioadenosine/S-adenosylhomocysteine nucleosidase [Motiliproteus sp. MSK22-1]